MRKCPSGKRGRTRYEVHIRNNETGEVRIYRSVTVLGPWDSFDLYDWESGNHSCDCNRGACFNRVANPEDWDFDECGETKYDVLSIVLEDGTVFPFAR